MKIIVGSLEYGSPLPYNLWQWLNMGNITDMYLDIFRYHWTRTLNVSKADGYRLQVKTVIQTKIG
jgi:hypothetical protein